MLGRRKNCFRERGESIDRSIEVIDDRMRDRTNEFRTREREREGGTFVIPVVRARYMTDVCAAPFVDGARGWRAITGPSMSSLSLPVFREDDSQVLGRERRRRRMG